MGLFKTKNLYRIEITERCYYYPLMGGTGTAVGTAMPSLESIEKNGNWGTIPVGIKGWVVEKFGRKYFRPDENQEGLDLFMPVNEPVVLIPYRKIEGHYKRNYGYCREY